MSGNLGLSQIAANQANKHVVSNAADDEIARAITESLDVSVASGNVTISAAQYQRNLLIRIAGAATGGRTVTLPQVKRALMLAYNASSTHAVSLVRGTTTANLPAQAYALIYTDGTANGLTVMLVSGAALLDLISTTHGATLFRGAGGWVGLAPGSPGQVLTTGGPGVDVQWATPSGGAGSVSGTTLGKSADQAIANVTWTLLSWTGGGGGGNSRLPIVSGKTNVLVTCNINWEEAGAGVRYVYLYKNSGGVRTAANLVAVSGVAVPINNYPVCNLITYQGSAGAGDYYEVWAYHERGSSLNVIGPTNGSMPASQFSVLCW